MRQTVSWRQSEFSNSSADAKASTLNPNERMSRTVESRIKESSSTTHTNGFSDPLALALITSGSKCTPAPEHSALKQMDYSVRRGILLSFSTGAFLDRSQISEDL